MRLVSCGILANREFSIKHSTTIGQLVEALHQNDACN